MYATYINKDWKDALIKAQECLEQDDVDEAKKILKPFESCHHYKKTSHKIFRDYLGRKALKSAHQNGDYQSIYAMANKHEAFKNFDEYRAAEQLWRKNISSILSLVANGQTQKTNILELLQPFVGIPQKVPMIQLVLRRPDVLINFRQALHKRDFVAFFNFLDEFVVLRESEECAIAENMAQNIINGSKKAIDNEDIDKAQKLLDTLAQFPTKKEEYGALKNTLHALETLYILSETKDYEYIFELAEKHLFLKDTVKYKQITASLQEKLLEARRVAKLGDVGSIKHSLSDILKLPMFYDEIREILSQCFYSCFLKKLEEKKITAKNVVSLFGEYISIFSRDANFELMLKKVSAFELQNRYMNELAAVVEVRNTDNLPTCMEQICERIIVLFHFDV